MLVLTRKIGEKIMIGDDIVLTVVQIDRGKIRLGIEAPKSMPIVRSELIGMKDAEAGKAHTEEAKEAIRQAHPIDPDQQV